MSPLTKSQKQTLAKMILHTRRGATDMLESFNKRVNMPHQFKERKEWAEGQIKELESILLDLDELEALTIENEHGEEWPCD